MIEQLNDLNKGGVLKEKKAIYGLKQAPRGIVIEQLNDLNKGGVLKVKKAIYGLKQAPREWWKELLNFLITLGFVTNAVDPCLLALYIDESTFVILLLYIDDILIAATSKNLLDKIVQKLRSKFKVSSEGQIDNYLGITIRL